MGRTVRTIVTVMAAIRLIFSSISVADLIE